MKFLLLLLPLVNCYGFESHSYLGKLTDNYLKLNEPKIYNKIITLLDNSSISSISSWADKIKRTHNYSWTSQLHYIDILQCNNLNDTNDTINTIDYCKNNCIVSVIQDFTNALKYNFNYSYIKNGVVISNSELLKFLIHFIQDFNQPMHLLGYDRGGNSFKINMYLNGRNISTNLHFIWDSLIPNYYIKNFNYTIPHLSLINLNYDSYFDFIQDILNKNLKNVSCKVYPKSHYLIFDDYFNDSNMSLLFDNYHKLIINTLLYIFK